MENTNTLNLGKPTEEEQLDWVGDLSPTHLCIAPDAQELEHPATPPEKFRTVQLSGSGHQLIATYPQPLSHLMAKQGQEDTL